MNTTKKDEALKLALEFIEANTYGGDDVVQLMTAIREALAEQPAQQQEPVAYMNPDDLEKMKRFGRGSVAWATPTDFCTQPVYTSLPASKPLTFEEIERIYDRYGGNMMNCARAIERAHGIKGDA